MHIGNLLFFKYFGRFFIRFKGRFSFYYTNPIEYSMNMCIYSQKWCIFRDWKKYFSCFYSHTWKCRKLWDSFGWERVMLSNKYFTCFIYIFCLVVKKWNRVNKLGYFFDSHLYPIFWTFEELKEISINYIYLFICSLSWHEYSNQELKLIIMIELSLSIRKHILYWFSKKIYFILPFHTLSLDPGVKYL